MASVWLRIIKCVIYMIDIIFSKTHMAHLMVSKINFFCQRDIRSANSNFIPCQENEKWQRLIVSMWHLIEISWDTVFQFMHTETGQISHLRSQDVSKNIPSDLVRKDATIQDTKQHISSYNCPKMSIFFYLPHFLLLRRLFSFER